MPKIKNKLGKERFIIEKNNESEIIEKASEHYRNSGHNVYDFVLEFFSKRSSVPSRYLNSIKNGSRAFRVESWEKLEEYVSTMKSK
ncbi:hypothetical protein A3K64_03655 [Candidatus Micrarchaeota archaeon RBG_16_36_9]|nr:MAG: hypothetical protein A3K64_03655 [Candidatus Micrarchaeota archaeon RBG_16_36_9]